MAVQRRQLRCLGLGWITKIAQHARNQCAKWQASVRMLKKLPFLTGTSAEQTHGHYVFNMPVDATDLTGFVMFGGTNFGGGGCGSYAALEEQSMLGAAEATGGVTCATQCRARASPKKGGVR